MIDGIDTGTISLECLRSRVSIIPQDPVLFSSTVRNNLDPFRLFSDEALWKSLEDVSFSMVMLGISVLFVSLETVVGFTLSSRLRSI